MASKASRSVSLVWPAEKLGELIRNKLKHLIKMARQLMEMEILGIFLKVKKCNAMECVGDCILTHIKK